MTASGDDITALDATALSEAIHARRVSCREVMQVYLARIARFNPTYNAIVSLRPDDELLAEADACDAQLARGASRGWLHGVPQAIKDLANAAGLPTTLGSPLMKHFIAPEDGLMAARMKGAGCIVIGMRPSQGRVPMWPAQDVWVSQLATEGPMGRSVRDVARLLQTQAGWSPNTPLSIASGADQTSAGGTFDFKSQRIGWLGDLNGYLAMEPGILDACASGLQRLQALGCAVEPARLGMAPERVWDAWLVWRRVLVASRIAPFFLQPTNRVQIKPEAQWEHAQAEGCSANQFLAASVARTSLYQQMLQLFEQHDFLALPTAQVWPFDAALRWPAEIAGRSMDTYHRWMEVVIYATFAGLPCISVPVGFNDAGLPMGMQLIGKPQDDAGVLRLAQAYEQVIGDWLAVRPSSAT